MYVMLLQWATFICQPGLLFARMYNYLLQKWPNYANGDENFRFYISIICPKTPKLGLPIIKAKRSLNMFLIWTREENPVLN
jgi:hypothetical protein